MKVKDLIELLQEHDPELPVCLGDWSEGYVCPHEDAVCVLLVENETYRSLINDEQSVEDVKGTFVCIGNPQY